MHIKRTISLNFFMNIFLLFTNIQFFFYKFTVSFILFHLLFFIYNFHSKIKIKIKLKQFHSTINYSFSNQILITFHIFINSLYSISFIYLFYKNLKLTLESKKKKKKKKKKKQHSP